MIEHDVADAFPKLDEAQLASLGHCSRTKLRAVRNGQILINVGDCNTQFFVIKSGRIEIVDDWGKAPKTIAMLGPGEFTGEVGQLTGNPSMVAMIVREEGEVFEVSPEAQQQLLNNHPDLSDMIVQAFIARRHLLRDSATFSGLRVIGARNSQETFRVRDFLSKNRIPFNWVDLESDPEVKQLLEQFRVTASDTPVVCWGQKLFLRNPSNRQLAEAIGLCRPLKEALYDLVVVGAGPAGLAAAVYGASEGLRTVVLEWTAPGGQAGRSMRIENYLGFPTGITGSELAERASIQAIKFGANIPVATQVEGLTFENEYPVVHINGGDKVTGKCLLIATGADYRLLGAEGCARFEGRGVYYAATPMEMQACGAEVVVVGGGNSAGQAAVYLAGAARRVYLVIRGDDLFKNMSSYLARRIEQNPHIEILFCTEVQRMQGDEHLAEVELLNTRTQTRRTLKTNALFSFIGAVPRTEWLPKEIERDEKGFIRTGPSLARASHRELKRQTFLLETSQWGVFAAGDVRSGSVKRVASAVGEGAMAVQFDQEYLRELLEKPQ